MKTRNVNNSIAALMRQLADVTECHEYVKRLANQYWRSWSYDERVDVLADLIWLLGRHEYDFTGDDGDMNVNNKSKTKMTP